MTESATDLATVDRGRLVELIKRERSLYRANFPRSWQAYEAGANHLLGGVPMTWMRMWSGGFPICTRPRRPGPGSPTSTGNELHRLLPRRHRRHGRALPGGGAGRGDPQLRRGSAAPPRCCPTEDAAWVAAELTRRFGVTRWSFTLTATDANRWAIRLARQLTGRPKILVFSYCYHGSVDESFIVATPDGPRPRAGQRRARRSTRARRPGWCEFNDLDALERELAHGDVAAVLMEPALTNIGIVLPEPGLPGGGPGADRASTARC